MGYLLRKIRRENSPMECHSKLKRHETIPHLGHDWNIHKDELDRVHVCSRCGLWKRVPRSLLTTGYDRNGNA